MDIWLKTRSCRKSKAGQSELGFCKLKLYVVIFLTHISTRKDRERLYRISWKLDALQYIFCFYYVPSFRRRGHSILPSVRQEVVSVQYHKNTATYCEIIFIHGVPIFVVFEGRLIHEIKNPTNNEIWEAVWHRYIAILSSSDLDFL
jgi:hypothetical protein